MLTWTTKRGWPRGSVLSMGSASSSGLGVVSDGPLTVYQGVTIGGSHGRHREDGRGGVFWQPHFGSDVIVYTNSCVFGPIYIGDGAIVKAGRIVTKDVGPGEKM